MGTMLGMTSFFAYSLASEATYKHRGSSAVEALIRKHTVYLRYIVSSDQTATPTVICGSAIPTREVNSSRFSCESGFSFELNADADPDPEPGRQVNANPCGSGSSSFEILH